MEKSQVPGWVWAVLVGAHVLTLGWVLHQGRWSFVDTGRYIQAAENLWRHGQLYARPWPGIAPSGQAVQEFTIRPAGYPLIILGLGGAGGWPVMLLVVQNVLSLLNLGLVLRWWARWAYPNLRDWALALAAVLTFPAQFIYASAVMSEMLLQTAVLSIAVTAIAFIHSPRLRYCAGGAVAVIVAFLLKPVFYPLAFVAVMLAIVVGWRYRRPAVTVIGVLPVLVVGLYMLWNQQRTGYFHFSSIAEINLLQYNAAGVLRQIAGPEVEEKWVTQVIDQANTKPDFATRQHFIQVQAAAMLTEHIGLYARQHVQGMVALFLDPGRFDLSQLLGWAPPVGGGLLTQARQGRLWQAVIGLPWGQLGLLGLVLLANVARLGFAVRGFRRLQYGNTACHNGRWVAVGLLLYVAALTGPLGAARFLVPVWPLLLALALAGLNWPPQIPLKQEG
ncbi:hypothetical protein [Hymenobacter negativus]|uniref:Glycosyltransferase RgtA/B/C/D-like domain-containing protein n=1 Tax=Hymenobacter negativus TaxID=2795026 RepID=A0ABS0QCX6_9BACT|nr:hypothetical protein [Hymenobacter negativus]MBH8560066.1 hypothetical protein [Hymenobacter negativus]